MVEEVLGEHGIIVVAQPLSRIPMLSQIPYSSITSANEFTLNAPDPELELPEGNGDLSVSSQLRNRAERRGFQHEASSFQQQTLPHESSQELRCLHRMILVQPNLPNRESVGCSCAAA